MSETGTPLPASEQIFVPTTTRNIERANHLMSVRAHPGFIEIMRLIHGLVQNAADQCADYPGWDPQQIVVLKVRMQAAKELRDLLLSEINTAIETGLTEARVLESEQKLPSLTPQEIIERGDHVRRQVLEKFDEMDTARESRSPGSF